MAKRILGLAGIFMLVAGAAMAQDIMVGHAYARAATPSAKSGAAFLMILNDSETSDRLLGVSTPFAAKAQLHTHIETGDGVMSMRHAEDGFELPAGGMIHMQRGGDHVMLMGVRGGFENGQMIPLTLMFEHAGRVEVEVPVDMDRKPEASHTHGDGHTHDHGSAD